MEKQSHNLKGKVIKSGPINTKKVSYSTFKKGLMSSTKTSSETNIDSHKLNNSESKQNDEYVNLTINVKIPVAGSVKDRLFDSFMHNINSLNLGNVSINNETKESNSNEFAMPKPIKVENFDDFNDNLISEPYFDKVKQQFGIDIENQLTKNINQGDNQDFLSVISDIGSTTVNCSHKIENYSDKFIKKISFDKVEKLQNRSIENIDNKSQEILNKYNEECNNEINEKIDISETQINVGNNPIINEINDNDQKIILHQSFTIDDDFKVPPDVIETISISQIVTPSVIKLFNSSLHELQNSNLILNQSENNNQISNIENETNIEEISGFEHIQDDSQIKSEIDSSGENVQDKSKKSISKKIESENNNQIKTESNFITGNFEHNQETESIKSEIDSCNGDNVQDKQKFQKKSITERRELKKQQKQREEMAVNDSVGFINSNDLMTTNEIIDIVMDMYEDNNQKDEDESLKLKEGDYKIETKYFSDSFSDTTEKNGGRNDILSDTSESYEGNKKIGIRISKKKVVLTKKKVVNNVSESSDEDEPKISKKKKKISQKKIKKELNLLNNDEIMKNEENGNFDRKLKIKKNVTKMETVLSSESSSMSDDNSKVDTKFKNVSKPREIVEEIIKNNKNIPTKHYLVDSSSDNDEITIKKSTSPIKLGLKKKKLDISLVSSSDSEETIFPTPKEPQQNDSDYDSVEELLMLRKALYQKIDNAKKVTSSKHFSLKNDDKQRINENKTFDTKRNNEIVNNNREMLLIQGIETFKASRSDENENDGNVKDEIMNTQDVLDMVMGVYNDHYQNGNKEVVKDEIDLDKSKKLSKNEKALKSIENYQNADDNNSFEQRIDETVDNDGKKSKNDDFERNNENVHNSSFEKRLDETLDEVIKKSKNDDFSEKAPKNSSKSNENVQNANNNNSFEKRFNETVDEVIKSGNDDFERNSKIYSKKASKNSSKSNENVENADINSSFEKRLDETVDEVIKKSRNDDFEGNNEKSSKKASKNLSKSNENVQNANNNNGFEKRCDEAVDKVVKKSKNDNFERNSKICSKKASKNSSKSNENVQNADINSSFEKRLDETVDEVIKKSRNDDFEGNNEKSSKKASKNLSKSNENVQNANNNNGFEKRCDEAVDKVVKKSKNDDFERNSKICSKKASKNSSKSNENVQNADINSSFEKRLDETVDDVIKKSRNDDFEGNNEKSSKKPKHSSKSNENVQNANNNSSFEKRLDEIVNEVIRTSKVDDLEKNNTKCLKKSSKNLSKSSDNDQNVEKNSSFEKRIDETINEVIKKSKNDDFERNNEKKSKCVEDSYDLKKDINKKLNSQLKTQKIEGNLDKFITSTPKSTSKNDQNKLISLKNQEEKNCNEILTQEILEIIENLDESKKDNVKRSKNEGKDVDSEIKKKNDENRIKKDCLSIKKREVKKDFENVRQDIVIDESKKKTEEKEGNNLKCKENVQVENEIETKVCKQRKSPRIIEANVKKSAFLIEECLEKEENIQKQQLNLNEDLSRDDEIITESKKKNTEEEKASTANENVGNKNLDLIEKNETTKETNVKTRKSPRIKSKKSSMNKSLNKSEKVENQNNDKDGNDSFIDENLNKSVEKNLNSNEKLKKSIEKEEDSSKKRKRTPSPKKTGDKKLKINLDFLTPRDKINSKKNDFNNKDKENSILSYLTSSKQNVDQITNIEKSPINKEIEPDNNKTPSKSNEDVENNNEKSLRIEENDFCEITSQNIYEQENEICITKHKRKLLSKSIIGNSKKSAQEVFIEKLDEEILTKSVNVENPKEMLKENNDIPKISKEIEILNNEISNQLDADNSETNIHDEDLEANTSISLLIPETNIECIENFETTDFHDSLMVNCGENISDLEENHYSKHVNFMTKRKLSESDEGKVSKKFKATPRKIVTEKKPKKLHSSISEILNRLEKDINSNESSLDSNCRLSEMKRKEESKKDKKESVDEKFMSLVEKTVEKVLKVKLGNSKKLKKVFSISSDDESNVDFSDVDNKITGKNKMHKDRLEKRKIFAKKALEKIKMSNKKQCSSKKMNQSNNDIDSNSSSEDSDDEENIRQRAISASSDDCSSKQYPPDVRKALVMKCLDTIETTKLHNHYDESSSNDDSDIDPSEVSNKFVDAITAARFHMTALSSSHDVLANLKIKIDFDIPELHKILTRITSGGITDKQRHILKKKKIKIVKDGYSEKEDFLIYTNFSRFCEVHNLENNPLPFLNVTSDSILSQTQKLRFVQFIGKGLDRRPLSSIYRRFQKLMATRKSGRFTPDEDEVILNYVDKMSKKKLAALEFILRRPKDSIIKRYKELIPNDLECA